MKKPLIFTALLLSLIICLGSAAAFGNTKKTENKKYYETVTVNCGETLWSIASKYNEKNLDLNDYTDEIMKFNNMESSFIMAGQKIVVPIYY